jgi:magnesium transporter
MTIIASRQYRAGVALNTGGSEIETGEPDFAWVGLLDPTEEEMRVCAEDFGLHPLAVEDAVHAHQLPKLEVYGEQLFIVARTAMLKDGRVTFGETSFFVASKHIVTVRHGSDQGHSGLRTRLEARPKALANGVDYVLHSLLDMIVDNYFPVMDQIAAEIEVLERSALDSALTREETQRLFVIRRDLLQLERVLLPFEDVCAKLANFELPAIDPEIRPYFRDVLDHVRRVESMAALQREVLNSIMQTSALLEQQKQSDITRKLASWAAILAVPTAIAGIYGMNFENMPELATQYGYFIVLAAITLVCVILWTRFRRAGWL